MRVRNAQDAGKLTKEELGRSHPPYSRHSGPDNGRFTAARQGNAHSRSVRFLPTVGTGNRKQRSAQTIPGSLRPGGQAAKKCWCSPGPTNSSIDFPIYPQLKLPDQNPELATPIKFSPASWYPMNN